MFGFKFLAAVAVMASAALAQLTVSSPASLQQCVPVALSWSGGTAPYFLAVLPGGQSSAAPLVNFGNVGSVTSYTWTVNVTSGTSVTLRVTDSTGTINYSSMVTIQSGSSSCLSSAAGGSSSAASSGAMSASSAASSGASSAMMSASSAASSIAMSASSSASGILASASSAASSIASKATSGAASAASSATSAAASAATSKASSANKVVVGSFGAMLLGAVGVVLA